MGLAYNANHSLSYHFYGCTWPHPLRMKNIVSEDNRSCIEIVLRKEKCDYEFMAGVTVKFGPFLLSKCSGKKQ